MGRSLQSMARSTHKQNTEQSLILELYIVNSLTYQQDLLVINQNSVAGTTSVQLFCDALESF